MHCNSSAVCEDLESLLDSFMLRQNRSLNINGSAVIQQHSINVGFADYMKTYLKAQFLGVL